MASCNFRGLFLTISKCLTASCIDVFRPQISSSLFSALVIHPPRFHFLHSRYFASLCAWPSSAVSFSFRRIYGELCSKLYCCGLVYPLPGFPYLVGRFLWTLNIDLSKSFSVANVHDSWLNVLEHLDSETECAWSF